MVTALNHSSKTAKHSKPSSFDIGGSRFGWEAIENMYKRELARRQNVTGPRKRDLMAAIVNSG